MSQSRADCSYLTCKNGILNRYNQNVKTPCPACNTEEYEKFINKEQTVWPNAHEQAYVDSKTKNFVEVYSTPVNPKDLIGSNKVNFGTLPVEVLCELSNALLEGEIKYTAVNWRTTPVQARAYYEAAIRHLVQWWGGEDIDQASGLSHIAKALATLTVLRDAMIHDKMIDNRPFGGKNYDWIEPYNKQVVELKQRLEKVNES